MAAGKTDTTEANAAVDDDDSAAASESAAGDAAAVVTNPPADAAAAVDVSDASGGGGSASNKPRGIDYSKWDHLDEVVVDREAAAKEAEGKPLKYEMKLSLIHI